MHSSFNQIIILLLFCIAFAYSTELPATRLLCTEHEIGIYDDQKESNHKFFQIGIEVPFDLLPNICEIRKSSRIISKRSSKFWKIIKSFKLISSISKIATKGFKYLKNFVIKGIKKLLSGYERVSDLLELLNRFTSVEEELDEEDGEDEEQQSLDAQKNALLNIMNGGGIEHLMILVPNLFEKLDKEFSMNLNWINVVKSEITGVRCSSRNSELIELKVSLKVPIFEIMTVKRCFDLGEVTNNQYQHYEFPWTTPHLIENHSVHLSKCRSKNGVFTCPKSALVQPQCEPDNLEMCIPHRSPFAKKDVKIFRKLPFGMVVYGDVEFVVIREYGISRPYKTIPFQLYYITAKDSEMIKFGSLNEPGKNGNKNGEIRMV